MPWAKVTFQLLLEYVKFQGTPSFLVEWNSRILFSKMCERGRQRTSKFLVPNVEWLAHFEGFLRGFSSAYLYARVR